MNVSPKVVAAFNHVKQFHPEVVRVAFSIEGHWVFTGIYGNAPEFHPNLNINIVQDAVDDLPDLPAVFLLDPISGELKIESELIPNEYFLVGAHYVYDIGKHESHEEARNSDYCLRMGGANNGMVLNRSEAHEVMRQLKLKLSHYDNSMLKQ